MGPNAGRLEMDQETVNRSEMKVEESEVEGDVIFYL